MTSGTGPLGQDSQDRISRTGQLGQTVGTDSWDRTVGTGQLGQDSWDRTVLTGQSRQIGPTEQAGQVSLERKMCRCRYCTNSAEGHSSLPSGTYQALLCQNMQPWISATYSD